MSALDSIVGCSFVFGAEAKARCQERIAEEKANKRAFQLEKQRQSDAAAAEKRRQNDANARARQQANIEAGRMGFWEAVNMFHGSSNASAVDFAGGFLGGGTGDNAVGDSLRSAADTVAQGVGLPPPASNNDTMLILGAVAAAGTLITTAIGIGVTYLATR